MYKLFGNHMGAHIQSSNWNLFQLPASSALRLDARQTRRPYGSTLALPIPLSTTGVGDLYELSRIIPSLTGQ
jgi:hypothetical protein